MHRTRISLTVGPRLRPASVVASLLLATPAALMGACTSPSPSSARAPAAPPSAAPSPAAAAPRIDGAEAHRLVAAGALLLDVRSPDEFSDGHIEGAVNIPVDQVDARLSSLPRDKPIVVYCAMGSRSARAATLLAAAGFDVKNLGPMASWNR
jgi:phage shock protein E